MEHNKKNIKIKDPQGGDDIEIKFSSGKYKSFLGHDKSLILSDQPMSREIWEELHNEK